MKRNRLYEDSLHSLKGSPIAFIIRDNTVNKYLLENPEGIDYSTPYSNDAWWGENVDDAAVFTDLQTATYTREDVISDFGEDASDRFDINAVYSEDVYVKDAPINIAVRESRTTNFRKFMEDYAQDRKELDYLETERDRKQLGYERALADTKKEISKIFGELCDTLDILFEPFGFYVKDSERYWSDDKVLCFKNKDDNQEYELKSFSIKALYASSVYDKNVKDDYLNRYMDFRNRILADVIARVMDGLYRKNDKYYPLEAEEFASYKDGISKLEKLADDFRNRILPLFKEASEKINKEDNISASRMDRDVNLYHTRQRARKSYIKENPIAPGMVVKWYLQNGDDRDVEVLSVDNSNQIATIKTDGGSIRKVPLNRLEVDTVRAGIDPKYY